MISGWRAVALASAGWLSACAGSPSDPPVPARVRPPTNAVVVSVTFMEVAPAAVAAGKTAAAAPTAAGATSATPTPPARPRAAATARNAQQRTPQPATPQPPPSAGKAVEARPAAAPAALPAPRYTYGVQLDNGDYRSYGFAQDQGLTVGRRVLVNDSGLVVVATD